MMDKKTLKNIMHFLEKEDNKSSVKWKLLNKEPFTEDELVFKGDLDLNHLNITSLPEGLKVEGNLNLRQTIITSLPKGLKVGGFLSLAFTKITSLPEGLEVRGFLSLSHSDIESLPEGLKVGWSLILENCKNLTSLSKGLEVGWDLNITGTKLQKYTDEELREMIEPGFIEGRIIR
jgi:hypothetical protein